jgi:hypothetical protein
MEGQGIVKVAERQGEIDRDRAAQRVRKLRIGPLRLAR